MEHDLSPPYPSQAHMLMALMQARWTQTPIPEIGFNKTTHLSYSAIRSAGRLGAAVSLNPVTGNVDISFPDGSECSTNVEGNRFVGPPTGGES